jgi:hypothetical protein
MKKQLSDFSQILLLILIILASFACSKSEEEKPAKFYQ